MMKLMYLSTMFLTLAVILVMFSNSSEARKRKAGGVCGLTCYREVMGWGIVCAYIDIAQVEKV